ncbi:hypothetical protein CF319_g1870 [Tilletia indica]|nr:hypothetical protein CF319_g1870 [Tilletia indica]
MAAAQGISAGKRKRGSDGDGSGSGISKNARRRTLIQQARHIDVAPLPSASASSSTASTAGKTAGAGTPGQGALLNSTSSALKLTYQPTPATLPTHLALSTHIQARSYQLSSFQRALLSARTAANTRAWQLLPRHARRRAASHNLLRLPKRMRNKAASELKASNTLALRKAQIRRRFGDDTPLSRARKRTAILLLRAAKNSKLSRGTSSELKSNTVTSLARASQSAADRPSHWLETHLWHTKRFHISSSSRSDPKHGRDMGAVQRAEAVTHAPFALAYRPHMKGHRAAVRASREQCTLRDVSWWANVRLCVRIAPSESTSSETAMMQVDNEGASTSQLRDQAQSSAMHLLRQAGARDGWQKEWTSGVRMCYTALLGPAPPSNSETVKIDNGKGKARQLDEPVELESGAPLCHALFPLNIVWLPNVAERGISPTQANIKNAAKSKTSRQRKGIRERAAAEDTGVSDGALKGQPASSSSNALLAAGPHKQKVVSYDDDEDDMDAMMNAQAGEEEDDMDADMNAQGEEAYADEDEEAVDADGADGKMQSGSEKKEEETKSRRKYRRSRKKKKKNKSGTAKLSPSTTSVSTDSSAATEDGVMILLQTHPACIPHLLNTLRQKAYTLPTPSSEGRIIVELEELNVAPSAGVAVGRGRPALQPDQGRRGNVGALLRRVEFEKKKRQGVLSRPKRGEKSLGAAAVVIEKGREGISRMEGFNAFELIGPEAGRVLVGVLKPVARTAGAKLDALQRLVDPDVHSSLPEGWVLSLDVYDPRLSFPPKLPKRSEEKKDGETAAASGGDGSTETTEIAYGRLLREGGSLPKFSKGTIDKRRAKNLIPGTPLKPAADDDIVPITIIRRTLTSSLPISASTAFPHSAESPRDHPNPMDGFTLLVPRGWGSAFFHSLSYPSPTPVKVIGLSQARQAILESGCTLSFPHDWAHAGGGGGGGGTTLFERWAERLGEEEWKEWKRRPPAKRENWDAKGVRWPFGPCFQQEGEKGQEGEGESMWMVFVKNAVRIARSGVRLDSGVAGRLLSMVLAGRSDDDDEGGVGGSPWLCCVPSLALALFDESSSTTLGDPVWAGRSLPLAFVPIRLQACRKGIFGQWAEIHLPSSAEEAAKWRGVLVAMENDRKRGERLAEELGPWAPPAPAKQTPFSLQPRSTHVGTVTSGDYALTQGRGSAVGVISLVAWLELCAREPAEEEGEKKKKGKKRNEIPKEALVFVRERTSEMYRLASAEYYGGQQQQGGGYGQQQPNPYGQPGGGSYYPPQGQGQGQQGDYGQQPQQGGYYPPPPQQAYGGQQGGQQGYYPQQGQPIYVQGQQKAQGGGGGGGAGLGCCACLGGAALCCCAEEMCLDCMF